MEIVNATAQSATDAPSSAAIASQYPPPREGEWEARNFQFGAGEVFDRLRLHYTTIGDAAGDPVVLLHGTAGSGAEFPQPRLRRRIVRSGTAVGREPIFHNSPRRARGREILQALGRPARPIPPIRLRRHGPGAIQAADRGAGRSPFASGDRQFDGRDANLDLGRDLPRLHGRAGPDGVAPRGDVRPQLDDAAHADRRDPLGSRLARRRLRLAAEMDRGGQCFLRHRHERRNASRFRRPRPRARRPTVW